MANTPKQRVDRRAAVEEMRRAERAAARRRMIVLATVTGVVALGLIAAVTVPAIMGGNSAPARGAIAAIGVPAAQAGCADPITQPATGVNDHVEPGVTVRYDTAPPAFGKHDGQYITDPRHFYSPRDRPSVEKLVHSLEHGYTIVWYDDTVSGDQLQALRDLAVRMPKEANPGRWFIVAPWAAQDVANRGSFPKGTHVAMTHWGATDGVRQYCGKVSGAAVAAFVAKHPASDAPEAGGV